MSKQPKNLNIKRIHVEMFPESFNMLRRTLHDKHQDIWQEVQGFLALDGMKVAIMFGILNKRLGTTCTLDMTINEACNEWLRALEKRNVSQIILPPGYRQ